MMAPFPSSLPTSGIRRSACFPKRKKETSMSTIVAHHKVKGVLPETVVVCIEA